MAGCAVAIDVGGTFTDIALAELATEQLWTTKTPTTPHDQSQGFPLGVAEVLQQANKGPGDIVTILHAGRLAELLGMPTVIIPRYAGILARLGLLHSDIKNDYVRTMLRRHNAFNLPAIDTAFSDLATQAQHWLTEEGIAPALQRLACFADLRYANQGYEITVPVPAIPLTETTLAQTITTFHKEHHKLYTYAAPELPVALVNLRVSASGPARPFPLQPLPRVSAAPIPQFATRAVYFPNAGGFAEYPVYDYATLQPETRLTGPAIFTQEPATLVVQPAHQAHLDRFGNVTMDIPQHPS